MFMLLLLQVCGYSSCETTLSVSLESAAPIRVIRLIFFLSKTFLAALFEDAITTAVASGSPV